MVIQELTVFFKDRNVLDSSLLSNMAATVATEE